MPGTGFKLRVDAVVMAIGSGAEPENKGLGSGIRYFRGGLIRTHKDGVGTSQKMVYAGGDAARGPALIVNAVADGKEAAKKITKALSKKAQG